MKEKLIIYFLIFIPTTAFALEDLPCKFDPVEIAKLKCVDNKESNNLSQSNIGSHRFHLIKIYSLINLLSKKKLINKKNSIDGINYGERIVRKKKLFNKENTEVALPLCGIKMVFKSTNKNKCKTKYNKNASVVITGGTHGDEVNAVDVVVNLMENYASGLDSELDLKNDLEIYWIPVVHPFNYCKKVRRQGYVDPNRSFEVSGISERKKQKTPVEISSLSSFYTNLNPTISIDYHESHGNGFVLFPLANKKYVSKETNEKFNNGGEKKLRDTALKIKESTSYSTGRVTEMGFYGAQKATASSVDYWYENTDSLPFGIELPRSLGGIRNINDDYNDNLRIIKNLIQIAISESDDCKNEDSKPNTQPSNDDSNKNPKGGQRR
ncbi:MAG: M14 family zinc carboxypeptidase [Bacteriovoracaceae bacterium]|nr:M14 family zinc carboxypeptidase [Bacteriovoracaceae bacterium]